MFVFPACADIIGSVTLLVVKGDERVGKVCLLAFLMPARPPACACLPTRLPARLPACPPTCPPACWYHTAEAKPILPPPSRRDACSTESRCSTCRPTPP
jgi:hypothetical protein